VTLRLPVRGERLGFCTNRAGYPGSTRRTSSATSALPRANIRVPTHGAASRRCGALQRKQAVLPWIFWSIPMHA